MTYLRLNKNALQKKKKKKKTRKKIPLTIVKILTHVCYQTNITDDRGTGASPEIFILFLVIFGRKLTKLMPLKRCCTCFCQVLRLSKYFSFLVYLRRRNKGEKELMRTYDSGFNPFQTNVPIFIPPIRKQEVF